MVQQQYNYGLEKRRNLSLPRLCLRTGSSLDIIASQILLNGVVTLRSHDVDPICPSATLTSARVLSFQSPKLAKQRRRKESSGKNEAPTRWKSDRNLHPRSSKLVILHRTLRKIRGIERRRNRRSLFLCRKSLSAKWKRKFLKTKKPANCISPTQSSSYSQEE